MFGVGVTSDVQRICNAYVVDRIVQGLSGRQSCTAGGWVGWTAADGVALGRLGGLGRATTAGWELGVGCAAVVRSKLHFKHFIAQLWKVFMTTW